MEGMTPDEVAARARALAERAAELAREAEHAAAVDDDLRRLDAALAELDAETRRLDESLDATAAGDEPDDGEGAQDAEDAGPGGAAGRGAEGATGTGTDRDAGPGSEGATGTDGDSDAAGGADGDDGSGAGFQPPEWLGTFTRQVEEAVSSVADAIRRGVATTAAGVEVGERRAAVEGPVPVRVRNHGGGVKVVAGAGDAVVVRARQFALRPGSPPAELSIERDGAEVVVHAPRRGRLFGGMLQLEVEVPAGSPVSVATGGGNVTVAGVGGPVTVRSGGGLVEVDHATDVRVTSGAGNVRLDGIDGAAVVRTGGGSVRVAGRLRGESSLGTGGGSIEVDLHPASAIEVVARGSSASTSVPGLVVGRGRVTGTVASGADGRLTARTGGGSVTIRQQPPVATGP